MVFFYRKKHNKSKIEKVAQVKLCHNYLFTREQKKFSHKKYLNIIEIQETKALKNKNKPNFRELKICAKKTEKNT